MKIKPLIFPTIALFVGMTLHQGAIARQLNEYEQQVDRQLQQAIQMSKGQGYQLLIPRTVGTLARRAEAPKTLLLRPDREYNFIAVCDQNCTDVNLIVKDINGKVVASDVTGYPIAVINFKPPAEDRYQVLVRMEKCAARTCNFGLGIFSLM